VGHGSLPSACSTSTGWSGEPCHERSVAGEPNFRYRLLRTIHSVFRLLFPNRVIQADDLARAMVDIVIRRTREPKGLVLENRDIRAMVGSLHPSSRDCEWSPIWSGACRYAAPNTTASALVGGMMR
jgi:hypothetical protein